MLDNQTETNFRAIGPNFAVFAISRDLGGRPSPQRSLFYKTRYSDDTSLVSSVRDHEEERISRHSQIVDFLDDFANASSRAQNLDQKILQDAAFISDRLSDLVSLATAQVYGSTQLTIGRDASGNFNTSDVMMFMKNIGGSTTK